MTRWLCAIVLADVALRCLGLAALTPRPVTVTDSIEMVEFARQRGTIAVFSPDKSRFVVVTHQGNLADNTNDYRILLFDSKDALNGSSRGKELATLASASNRPAIANVTWENQSTLLFLGAQGQESSAIYSLDVDTRQLSPRHRHKTDLLAFQTSQKAGTLVIVAARPPTDWWDTKSEKTGLVIDRQNLTQLLIDPKWRASSEAVGDFFVLEAGMSEPRRIDFGDDSPRPTSELALSPDGKYLVARINVAPVKIPSQWRNYLVLENDRKLVPEAPCHLLVDLKTGVVSRLLDAPSSWRCRRTIAWKSDSSGVIVSGTCLPMIRDDSLEEKNRRENLFTVEVEIGTGKLTKIARGMYDIANWDPEENFLVLEPPSDGGSFSRGDEPGEKTVDVRLEFQKRIHTWEKIQSAQVAQPLDVVVEENVNSPPCLVAIDNSDGRRRTLLDPNPRFRELAFGRVEQIEWKDREATRYRGGLYFPPGHAGGSPRPLVIQTHGWNAKSFSIDGYATAGYAAQALAGKGFLVAQIPLAAELMTLDEGPKNTAMIEGLVDSLFCQGLIDRNRIGLLGWSRTGLHVRHALTFSAQPFAAAVIADGMDASYGQYLAWGNQGKGAVETYENVNGGVPFGDGLKAWMTNATGFNLTRVQTPVRLLGFRSYSLLNNWEWFVGLRALGKPVEFIWLPGAAHAPVRPWERVTAQEGTVDWFCYWLLGERGPDPGKAAQYARWQQMEPNKKP